MKKLVKNKIKKSTLRKDYYEVTMEYIKDTVQVIAEGQQAMGEKFERKFDELSGDLNEFKQETRSNFKTVFEYLSNIDDELKAIKNEILDLKERLKNKADLVRLETLELRVDKIERDYATMQKS